MSKDTPRPLPQDEIERTSDFRAAELSGQDFSKMGLPQRDFRRALLRGAKFIGCDLQGANFADAELSGANFKDANLQDVDFSNANLTKANFYKANLVGAAFLGSNLFAANFREARMGQTVFSNTDMETCVGLDSVVHEAPSSIAVDCLFRSGHNLPLSFLAGAGMPKLLLDYVPELVQATTPIQFHSCFISYSHLDEAFARRLWAALRNERIRVWYAPEEMQGGKKLFEQIDRAIQLHDKLLVVLSKAGLASEWVRTEIKRARRKERQTSERKLFPIRLCGMDELLAWECFDADTGRDIAEEVREYFIPDFSDCTKPARFDAEFTKLRRDLRKEGVPMRTTK
jgi:uncharacterized protein YjbI with pentapeptide repeats